MTKTATETREEYEQQIKELSTKTLDWARGQGCYRDESSNEIMGFFVIDRKKSAKPCWCNWSNESYEVWVDVREYMLANGVSLCYQSFGGHYIGLEGEQGTSIGTNMNNTFTRAQTILRHLQYLLTTGQFDDARQYISKRLASPYQETDVLKLMVALEQMLMLIGPYQQSIFSALLKDGKARPEDDAA
jgi:hypothetical protein